MITNRGRTELVSFASGQETSFGTSVALGVGSVAATVNDQNLQSESIRVPVVLRSPDYVNNRVIFKATVPRGYAGKFYEVGLVSGAEPRVSQVLFGDIDEVWTNGVQDATNARVGQNAVRIDANSSGNKTASIDHDISVSVGNLISLNYFVGSNVSSAYIRLRTDASNYFHYALPVTAGYNSQSVPLTSFAPTGAPDPSNISSVVVYLASTAGGASQLHLDAISLVEPLLGGDLLARQVLAQPITKSGDIELDIEWPLGVTIA